MKWNNSNHYNAVENVTNLTLGRLGWFLMVPLQKNFYGG